MKTEKYILLGGVFLIILFMGLSTKDMPVVSKGGQTFMSGLTWYNSIDTGMEVSAKTGKPVLVYFWASWCKFCKKLEEETYVDPEVNSILKNDFVLVAINIDDQADVAAQFGVSAPPAEVFLSPDGQEITRIPGYVNAETFLPILRQIKNL
jgi:hypothetical protein